MPRNNAVTQLARLLDQRNERPERLSVIDGQIRRRFEAARAVLVLDMCGFSRLSLRYGIIHFLAMIRRLHRAVAPVIARHRGRVVKAEADNVFALFPDVPAAIAGAMAIQKALAQANQALPADWDLHVGIGIGYGPLLLIGDHELYGEQLNLAAKLGEDLAGAGEILLTKEALQRAGRHKRRFVGRRARLSRMTLNYAQWTPAV